MASSFEDQVKAQIDRLKNNRLTIIEAEEIFKRRAWFDNRPPEERVAAGRRPSPRRAFETLFFEYMGLPPEQLPILKDDDEEIVWSSRNRCPTLEACLQLGLDTRVVCRAAYEKSTQSFVSCIDPELRFLRSYDEIRPLSHHCLERIVRVPFKDMMRLALDEGRQSRCEGGQGGGAVAVLGRRILARAHDTAEPLHAAVNAIRQAAQVLGDDNLSGVILFSTCEPCPMCCSLAVRANLSAMVFGASIEQTAANGTTRMTVPAREIVARSPVTMEVFERVLEQECLSLHGLNPSLQPSPS